MRQFTCVIFYWAPSYTSLADANAMDISMQWRETESVVQLLQGYFCCCTTL